MKVNRTLLITVAVLAAALIVACEVNYRRVLSERSNNTVEIVIDQSDVERLAVFSGVNMGDLYAGLKNSGVVSVALSEDLPASSDNNFLSGTDPKKVNIYLRSKGLSKEKISAIKGSGLTLIPRIRNSFDQSTASINKKIKDISGSMTVIFAEEEVLGYPNYIGEASRAIKKTGMNYGFIEFGKQLGDTALASFMGGNIIKVHSIPVDEMEGLSRIEMVQRFARAARERDIRIIYVHLIQYPDNGKDLISTNTEFIKSIKSALLSDGFRTGRASKPSTVKVSRNESLIMSAGVASGVILLLMCFIRINAIWALVIGILCFISPVKYVTLLSAVVFPSYGVISQFPIKKEEIRLGMISRSISMTMNVAGITAVGAVLIAAMLADKIAMLGIDSFIGVKIAFVLPILIVASYFILRDESTGKIGIKEALKKITEVLNMNVTIMYAVMFFAALGAAALLLLRSGNFGLPVSGGEKFARGVLETALSVRPRTKEFLIGYPALILASIYYLRGVKIWLWAVLSIGVIAPISLVNTFCHIHSPLLISITRSCIGIVIGVAIGFLLYYIIEGSIGLYNRYTSR